MLDADTKRKIDTARDILVGKVPDPKTQVEQITFALIYKFMDNMDQQSVGLGGKPSFFTNGYEQFAWSKLLDRKRSGPERLDLYVRALEQMAQNPYIPQLFRDIFKGAFLPYRDSETLNLFLKELDGFRYDHSEDLGDAYEYLLNILGTQGKAGQFRTPRHIIDFIVRCVDPDKNETVLDPACGTAGFLISAFKHIEEKYREHPLSPDEKKRLTENFTGYDIAPDMVRLSRVNMYLHQFPNPTIHEYDSLTTEDRWDDSFDVILANPPFMTPTGGIRPHNRFAVRANRSEVLFVDYIAEHLNPGGRAGIIVPEGIIFQSSNAYKALRKMLVEGGYLYAVVSLPAGVFNPYSGVKTSILLLDKSLARRADSILFVKVSADGFDLGAQRREIERSDLPEALALVKAFQADPRAEPANPALAQRVKKARLAESEDYNLSAERYQVGNPPSNHYPMVSLVDVATIDWGNTNITKSSYNNNGAYLGVSASGCDGRMEHFEHNVGVTVLSAIGANCGRVFFPNEKFTAIKNTITFSPHQECIHPKFLYLVMVNNHLPRRGGGQPFMTKGDVEKYQIPLPPLEVQQEIVAEIEGYQKVIDGARMVVENYKPVIPIDPAWPLVRLGDVCEYVRGVTYDKTDQVENEGVIVLRANNIDLASNSLDLSELRRISSDKTFSEKQLLRKNDVFICSASGSKEHVGKVAFIEEDLPYYFGGFMAVIRANNSINPKLLFEYLRTPSFRDYLKTNIIGANINNLKSSLIFEYLVPLPPMDMQERIVHGLDEIQRIVSGNIALIKFYEAKVVERIQRVWEQA